MWKKPNNLQLCERGTVLWNDEAVQYLNVACIIFAEQENEQTGVKRERLLDSSMDNGKGNWPYINTV